MPDGVKLNSKIEAITQDEFVSILESMASASQEDGGWCTITTGVVEGQTITLIDSSLGYLKA
jgi:hypothetical protein